MLVLIFLYAIVDKKQTYPICLRNIVSDTCLCYLWIAGSGSSYLYALLDHEWKEGMSQEEAEVCRQVPSYLDPRIEILSSVVVWLKVIIIV